MQHRRLLTIVASAALAVGAGLLAAPSAQADGGFCYDVDVVVNGESVVDEAACEALELPGAPELPGLPALP